MAFGALGPLVGHAVKSGQLLEPWREFTEPDPDVLKSRAPHVGALDQLVTVIDDDVSVQRALRRLLASVSLRSECYRSARAYLESADLDLTDCLLLDLYLPEMSGIELLEHLTEVAPNLPVICMTGRDEPELEQRATREGAGPCLRKPFDEAELFEALSPLICVSVGTPRKPRES